MILLAHLSDVSVRINIGTFSAILVGSEMQNGVFILIGTHEGNVFLQVMNFRFCVYTNQDYTAKVERMKWCMESIMQITQICCKIRYVAFTRVFGPFITKTIANHRTWIWVKPLKNHRCQWSICKKTFNGDGQGVAKPLKNHRWQWCPEEKTLPSHRLKKMTIVEV